MVDYGSGRCRYLALKRSQSTASSVETRIVPAPERATAPVDEDRGSYTATASTGQPPKMCRRPFSSSLSSSRSLTLAALTLALVALLTAATDGEEPSFSGYQVLRVLVLRRDTADILRSYRDRPGE